ncbi:23098_t:CDS:2, partial [Racocetra persica]
MHVSRDGTIENDTDIAAWEPIKNDTEITATVVYYVLSYGMARV